MFGGQLPELIRYSFLNPTETTASEDHAQQINEMHQKRQGLQPSLVHRKGPVLLHDKAPLQVAQLTLQKLNKLGYDILPHLPYSPDLSPLTTTFSSILMTFCRENTYTTSRMQKKLSKSLSYPEAQIFFFFCYRNKQTYFSLAKMC